MSKAGKKPPANKATTLAVPRRGTTSRGTFYLGEGGDSKSKRPDLDRELERAGFSYNDRGEFHDRALRKAFQDSTTNARIAARDSAQAGVDERFSDLMADEARSARRDSMKARGHRAKPTRRKA
jgi:hypothetical protein